MAVIYRERQMPDYLESCSDEIIEKWKQWIDAGVAVSTHPKRYYTYVNEEEEVIDVDLIQAWSVIYKSFNVIGRGVDASWPKNISKEEVEEIKKAVTEIQLLKVKKAMLRKAWDNVMYSNAPRDIFSHKKNELISMFGQWKTIEEVKNVLKKEWKTDVPSNKVKEFFYAHQEEIEKERTKWEENYQHISITKKRGRIEQLAYLYDTQKTKYESNDHPINRSQELRKILDDLRRELEGDRIVLDIHQKIDIDMTINVNQTYQEIFSQIPLLSFIVGITASRRRKSPLGLMYALQTSIYNRYSGIAGVQENGEQQDLTILPSSKVYDWLRMKDNAYDAEIVSGLEYNLNVEPVDAQIIENKRDIVLKMLRGKQAKAGIIEADE